MSGLVLIQNGNVRAGNPDNGLTTPSESMERIYNREGGDFFAAFNVYPPLNPRVETYGAFNLLIRPDKVNYVYPVVDKPLSQAQQYVKGLVDDETQARIFAYFGVDNMTEALRKEINAMTESNTEAIDMLLALRTAGKSLKAEIDSMDRNGLVGLIINQWEGWPS